MERSRALNGLGVLLVTLGIFFLLQNFGFLGAASDLLWAVPVGLGSLAFFWVFFNDRRQWWALIPGFVLLGVAGTLLLGNLGGAMASWAASALLGAIGLAFAVIFLIRREHWWAIIPAGILLTLALVTALSPVLPGGLGGGLFFFGLAATFGLVSLVPTPAGSTQWARIPAGILAVVGVLVTVSGAHRRQPGRAARAHTHRWASGVACHPAPRLSRRNVHMEEKQIHGVVWPVILIGAGLILLLNNLGYLSWDIWGILWRLWPILLIAAGLEILIGRRSFVGSLLVALFLVVVLSGVIWWGLQRTPGAITLPTFGAAQVDTREVAIHQALEGADRAEVVIGLNAGELRLDALPESASLIEGAIELRLGEEVEPRFDVQGDAATYALENKNPTVLPILGRAEGDILWQLGLNRDVPLQAPGQHRRR